MRSLVWITSAPAPYRFPVWFKLATMRSLTVALTNSYRGPHPWDKADAPAGVHIASRWKIRHVLFVDDLVVGEWENWRSLIIIAMRLALRRPYTIFYESTAASHRFQSGPIAILRRLVFRASRSVLTVGIASTEAVRAMGVRSERIYTSFNAVDVEWWSSKTSSERVSPNLNGPAYAAIYVGRLVSQKRVDLVIRAWAEIAAPDERFCVAGSGAEESALQDLARSLGIFDRVDFVRYLSATELAGLYARSSTLILVSDREVWGLVVNEALASGIHVVVRSDLGVARSVAGMKGVYLTSADVDYIAKAIRTSLNDWAGPISSPEILRHTPEALARDAIRAIERGTPDEKCPGASSQLAGGTA